MKGLRGALGIAWCVVLAACQPGPIDSRPLSSFQVDQVLLDVQEASASLTLKSFDCPNFTGTALMNGQPLVQTVAGREVLLRLPGGLEASCFLPTWDVPLPLPDEPLTTFEVLDESGRLVFGVNGLGARRTLALAPGQSSTVRWGETLQLEWSPASDDFSPTVVLHREGEQPLLIQGLPGQPMVVGGRITLLLPAAPEGEQTQGPAELVISTTVVHAGVERCEPYPEVCLASLAKKRLVDAFQGYLATFTVPLTFE